MHAERREGKRMTLQNLADSGKKVSDNPGL